ncbi:MAG TPA: hypothetical protein VN947_16155 [Polyangia bacterium]|nr:hypothetical protein [Polyangia bacterium]
MRRILTVTCTLVSLFAAPAAWAGDYVDTRLNFTLTDENLLVKPGETNPSVPGVRIGQPNSLGILFFDNYDTRYTGYENLTHLVIYKKMGNRRFTAEAAYVLRLLQFTDVNLSSIDDGSYIKITYWLDPNHEQGGGKTNIAFTAFPLNADRMRLGYSYRISWGGSPIFFKFNPDLPVGAASFTTNTNPAPGAKLQLSGERYYAYVGFKTSMLLNRNPQVNEQVAVYGALAGAGVDIIPEHLRVEANGGYFDRGTNPLFFGTTVGPMGMTFTDFPVQTYGGTIQVSAFKGISPTQSADFKLYVNDPMVTASRYFTRPAYLPGFNWLAAAEFTAVGTTLQDVARPNSTTTQLSYAGDVNLRAQFGHVRLRGDFETRSLGYILMNQPSLVPYQDFPAGAQIGSELFGVIGLDYLWERIGFTGGLSVGVERPATFTPPAGQPLMGPLTGNTGNSLSQAATIVVRNEGDISILPSTDAQGRPIREVPIFAAKAELRQDFLDWFAVILQVYYQNDGNQTHLVKAPDGTSVREFNHPNQIGFNLTLQARY